MNFEDLLFQRRSIRQYTHESIPKEKLQKILQAGLLAPSSRNKKPCQFYVIHKKDILEQLGQIKPSGAFIGDANAAIIVMVDTSLSDVWIEDCSIAMSYMQLMATALDIGSCWVQMRKRKNEHGKDAEEVVKEMIGVPNTYHLVGILSLGIPAQTVSPHTEAELDISKIHEI
ncbi:MAG: nitroreductase family protein [Absicoccus sp.]|uniref:Nitroreductase family protein n=1 Tax=Absicoccus intestinalis TaxID=2926319 RepID=A0ABU4WMQ7_9FIRM|nr:MULTISPECIES: nitroreductase family protein [unclassified Absicoccus]MDX8417058.1 nitroreductase family protein [Absicoccus sp. CLA-KB-P134]MDY3034643.1 nitroreductase family protein [Absicoccus sp.]